MPPTVRAVPAGSSSLASKAVPSALYLGRETGASRLEGVRVTCDKILKKVGEESTEVIIAAKADDKKETIYEISDLCYHVLVLMIEMGISLDDIRKELASRHVIDHKVKQEKMTK